MSNANYEIGEGNDDVDYGVEPQRITDSTAADVRLGKDIQALPWQQDFTRQNFRRGRLENFKSYENIPGSGERGKKECKLTRKDGQYYDFWFNTRSVRPTSFRFHLGYLPLQFRNTVWSTSKHDLYLVSYYSIKHWSSLSCQETEIMNVSGHITPTERHPGNFVEGFTRTAINTLAVRNNLLIAGGLQGELICKYLDRPGVSYCMRQNYEDLCITTAIDIYDAPSGSVHFTASNIDRAVRDIDMERFELVKQYFYPWPVNHVSLSPDAKLIVIVGDIPDGMLVDSQTGKTVAHLHGHLDFSFASAWHPNGYMFATGNQDKTCRVWDSRNLSSSVAILRGNIGAIRSIRFTSDGQFMATAESADFVHVYDVKNNFDKEQEIDFFGEVSGVSFSPDTESLFIGVGDPNFASLLQYNRRRNYSYSDCLY